MKAGYTPTISGSLIHQALWRGSMKRSPYLSLATLALTFVIALPYTTAQDADVQIITTQGNAMHTVISPAGNLVAAFAESVLFNNTVYPAFLPIRLISLDTGEEVAALTDVTDYTRGAAFTPDGTRL